MPEGALARVDGAPMETRRVRLDECAALTGAVVVVDVLRSFTTAAYGVAGGARSLCATDDPVRARALVEASPGALAVGSLPGGAPIPGFDLPNSPARLDRCDLAGRDLVLTTAGGVRGLLSATRADLLLAGSLVCARATARLLARRAPARVSFVITGIWTDRDGDEDHACADLIEALIEDDSVDPAPFEERVRRSDFGRRFTGGDDSPLPLADLERCARADRFDFALQARRDAGRIVLLPRH